MTNETVTKETRNIFYTNVNDLEEAMKQKHLYADYALLDETWKKRFDDYMTGKKTMPLTYDPFFKCMFHPAGIRTGCRICSAPSLENRSPWRASCPLRTQLYPSIPC